MSGYFARLNSSERRLLVGVGLLFFVIVNVFWIWPRFSDWGNLQRRIQTARVELAKRETAINQTPTVESQIAKLPGDTDVPPEDQALQFQTLIGGQAGRSGLGIMGFQGLFTRTNDPFFLEQVVTIQFQSGERQLVDFLYNLGTSASIRVSGLSVRSDPSQQQLAGNVTLVASYRKRAPGQVSPAPGNTRGASPAPGRAVPAGPRPNRPNSPPPRS